MLNLHFPSQHTEEEEALLAKYAKLKKKKKALAVLKAPKVEKQESVSELAKKPLDAAFDATEKAKKLLKLGAIKVGTDKKEQVTFKRKKAKETEGAPKPAVAFQPFSQGGSSGDRGGDDAPPTHSAGRSKPKYALYDNFVRSSNNPSYDKKEGDDHDKRRDSTGSHSTGEIKKGNTIYIYGHGLTEELMRKVFEPVGNIINVSMEPIKHCSFVTFDTVEAADKAIGEMNGVLVSGIEMKVQIARNQPSIENFVLREPLAPPPPSEPVAATVSSAASGSWSTIAASNSQKGAHKDQRDLRTYSADDDYF